jgi:ABC-type oligopeptide transport system substrate-binding subunit
VRWNVLPVNSYVTIHDEEDKWIATVNSPTDASHIVFTHNSIEDAKQPTTGSSDRESSPYKINWTR